MDRKRWLIVLVSALLGAGAALIVGSCGGGDGEVRIEGSTTGGPGTSTGGSGTTTGGASITVDENAVDAKALDEAMDDVAGYARRQTKGLVGAARRLRSAIDANDIPAAKRAYADGRPFYERIEPLVVLFPELDGKIDAREDAFPKKAADPKWTGYHPIERALWKDRRITAKTRRLAAGLVRDSRRLNTLMAGAAIEPEVVIPGTAELVDEVEESKITGEEERYSKLDLPTFLANLEGSRAFYEPLEPLVRKVDVTLADDIDSAFEAAFAGVTALKKGGRFVAYDALSDEDQRKIKQNIEALAEPLARVQGVLGVEAS